MTAGRGNRVTEADRAAWAGFTRHVVPLSGGVTRSASSPGQAPATPTGPVEMEPPVAATKFVSGLAARPVVAQARPGAAPVPLAIGSPPGGVDRATWQRFRTGKLAAARTLDLHGMTAQRAFHALTGFLRGAHAERLRCVEIVTGRGGIGGGGEGTGVIRREFPLWLNRPDIRPLVLGAAHPHTANPGAVRLLLRRIR